MHKNRQFHRCLNILCIHLYNFKHVGVDINVEFTNDLEDDVSADIIGTGPRSANVRLNNEYLLDDSVYHEFGHAYIDLLGLKHPLIREALKQLKGSNIEETVVNMYPNLKGIKLQKEIGKITAELK